MTWDGPIEGIRSQPAVDLGVRSLWPYPCWLNLRRALPTACPCSWPPLPSPSVSNVPSEGNELRADGPNKGRPGHRRCRPVGRSKTFQRASRRQPKRLQKHTGSVSSRRPLCAHLEPELGICSVETWSQPCVPAGSSHIGDPSALLLSALPSGRDCRAKLRGQESHSPLPPRLCSRRMGTNATPPSSERGLPQTTWAAWLRWLSAIGLV